MAEANPLQLARMIAYMQNPVQGLQMQQQQAIADQMMQQGQQQPPSNEMVGNHVVAYNPWGGLARMGSAILGAELTKENNQRLADMIRGSEGGESTAGNPNDPYAMTLPEMMMPGGLEHYKARMAGPEELAKQQNTLQDINGVKMWGNQIPSGNVPAPAPAPAITPQPGNMNPMLPNLVKTESGGNPNAVSPAGAGGLTQIMPTTARDPGYGVKPLQGWDGVNPATASPQEQLRFGNDYLNAMQHHEGGNQQLAAAAYNAGPGRVDAALKQLPAETQAYVPKVAGDISVSDIPPYKPPTFQQANDPNFMAVQKKYAEATPETVAQINDIGNKAQQLKSMLDAVDSLQKGDYFEGNTNQLKTNVGSALASLGMANANLADATTRSQAIQGILRQVMSQDKALEMGKNTGGISIRNQQEFNYVAGAYPTLEQFQAAREVMMNVIRNDLQRKINAQQMADKFQKAGYPILDGNYYSLVNKMNDSIPPVDTSAFNGLLKQQQSPNQAISRNGWSYGGIAH